MSHNGRCMAIAGMSVLDPSWTVSFPNDLGCSISQETPILVSSTLEFLKN